VKPSSVCMLVERVGLYLSEDETDKQRRHASLVLETGRREGEGKRTISISSRNQPSGKWRRGGRALYSLLPSDCLCWLMHMCP
jgi:hypothetical protein